MGRGMKAALAALLAALALAPVARAGPTAESMYQPGTVVSIKLSLPKESIEQIEEEGAGAESYADGTFSLAETEGSPATTKAYSTPIPVGIKLKGHGSYVGLGGKSAFKIKFKKKESFLGLQKMTLNNMVQDASMLHETMAYDLFRANRVPATNTGFAYVHVNLDGHEEDFGMHLNIETYDQVALEKRFGGFAAPQHLYEAEYGGDVTAAKESKLEVDEGDEGDRSDLGRLVAAVEGTSPADFSDRVAPYVDLQEMAHQWAVEKYIGHWDGYAGQEGVDQPNNYYLYSSATGVFQMLPWGTDQTWGDRLSFDGPAGVLFDDCLGDPSCATMYRRALRELLASLPGLELDSLATRTAALLKPWQEVEVAPRKGTDPTAVHDEVEATRTFAGGRPAELETFLAGGPAEPKAAHVLVTPEPGTIPVGGGTGTVTMTLTGVADEPIFGDQLSLSASDPRLSFGPVVDEGEGVYRSSFNAAPGSKGVTITAADATAGISGTGTLNVEEAAQSSTGTGTGSAGSAGTGTGGAPTTGAATPIAPFLTLGKRPGHRTTSRRPVFTFSSDRPGSTFVCRLGAAPFHRCSSPLRLPRLSRGHHVFSVVAVGPEGTRGEPRRYEFFVSIRRRTRVPD